MEIGADDSRFSKMEAASAALVDKLKTEPALIIPATLIAIDSDVGEKEPFFDIVESLVIEQWKTMRNTHVNRPRELLRSIIIDALALVSKDIPEIASAIWQTALSPLNHGQAKFGKEADLVKKLLQDFGEYAELEATARFGSAKPVLDEKKGKKNKKKEAFKLQSYSSLKETELVEDVKRTAGPQDAQGQAPPDPNPHWPKSDANWVTEFAPRMSAALAKAVNLGTSRLSDAISKSLQEYMNIFETRLTESLDSIETVRTKVLESQQSSQMRLNVLWWFEAMYSPTLKLGYRKLSTTNAAMAMAYDLTSIVPPLAPVSVTYILSEAVAALFQPQKIPKPQSIKKFLDDFIKDGSTLRGIVPKVSNNKMRQPLSELTIEAINGIEISDENVLTRTGINPSLELTFPEFAMWTFRDFNARRLIEGIK